MNLVSASGRDGGGFLYIWVCITAPSACVWRSARASAVVRAISSKKPQQAAARIGDAEMADDSPPGKSTPGARARMGGGREW